MVVMKRIILCSVLLFLPLAARAFSDLPETHRYYHALNYLYDAGVMNGYEDGTVRPDHRINRAELIKLLIEGLGKKASASDNHDCFPDVGTEWFAPYVCYAREAGWIAGYPDGTFRPAQNVNRAEALKIILNAFGYKTGSGSGLPFTDVKADDWYAPYLSAAVKKRLITESAGRFQACAYRTRGEVGEMLRRIMQIKYIGATAYADEIGAEFATLLLLNRLRLENGVSEKLVLNPTVSRAAWEHSKDMAHHIGDLSHTGSDGRESYDRIKSVMPEYGRSGENIGRGTVNASRSLNQAIKDVHYDIFMAEPDECHNHKTTLLGRCLPFREVGIGVYVKDGWMYFTEDFITGADTPADPLEELEAGEN